jgi:gamma-glutamyltranspeptidase/glutathione hydrolase
MTAFRSPLISIVAAATIGFAPAAAQAPGATLVTHPTAHRPAVTATKGLVTGGHPLGSMSGMRILLAGGNAFDAAVAVHAVLGLVKMSSSGPGGNGFATIYEASTGKVYSLNATGAAPMALPPEKMTAESLSQGIQAAMVPGLLGGWIDLLDRFGTMSLEQVLGPALEYAENGHPIEASMARAIEGRREFFERHPSSARVFLPEGRSPQPGEMFRYPDYARTLRRLIAAEKSALAQGKTRHEALQAAFDLFYKGDIAREMAEFYKANGGYMAYEDFAAYEPIWAEPLHVRYRGHDIYTTPSTSRGGFEVVMGLKLLEEYDLGSVGRYSTESLHRIAEAIKVSKADIYAYIADPKFTSIPVQGLLSDDYAAVRRQLIDEQRAIPFPTAGDPKRYTTENFGARENVPHSGPQFPEETVDEGTDSFSVLDQWGNVIAMTPTHGGGFGTGVIVGNTGFLSNNGLRLGSTSPYPDNVNYVRPGQIPILNNSPSIVMKDGRFLFSLGTPGGETIGQAQLQVMVNIMDFGMDIQEAIEAPRFNLSAEPNFYKAGSAIRMNLEGRVSEQTVAGLRAMGHDVRLTNGFAGGNMQGIYRDPVTGTYRAGADPRNLGYAIGWD